MKTTLIQFILMLLVAIPSPSALTAQILPAAVKSPVSIDLSIQEQLPWQGNSRRLSVFNMDEIRLAGITALSVWLAGRIDAEWDEEFALEGHAALFRGLKYYGNVGLLYDSPRIPWIAGGIVIGSWGLSRFGRQQAAFKTVKLMGQALLLTTVVTLTMKLTIGRHRPYADKGAYQFEPFDFSLNATHMSFPSGHTSSIFALMTVLAKRTDFRQLKILAYGFSGAVALQRMQDRKHWASDVIAGGVIGYMAACRVLRRSRRAESARMLISPYWQEKKIGVYLHF